MILGKDGKVLDKLNLDNIVKNYIGDLTEDEAIDTKKEEDDQGHTVELTESELTLLEMLNNRDTDASTVCSLLNITENDLNNIIHRLLAYEFLQYISSDEVAITELGQDYLNKQKDNSRWENMQGCI